MPKVSLNRSAVSTSPSAPAATTRPARISIAWVSDVGHVLDVMGDDDERRRAGVPSEVVEGVDQLFTAGEVESGRRFVEQHDGRFVHQRAGEQHPAALARRQGDQRVLGEPATPIRSRHSRARVSSSTE